MLHIAKGEYVGSNVLDGVNVDAITAFLFHRGGHADPVQLQANARKSFQGSTVLGMGFTFDDTDKKGIASPLAEMNRLLDENPRNREAIFPYIGGEEVNTSPTHAHHRYVISFRDYPLRREELGETWEDAPPERRRELRRRAIVPLDYPEPVAADWPELLAIVEARVKPSRMASANQSKSTHGRRAAVWWQMYHQAKDLHVAIGGLDRVLVNSQVSAHLQFAFLPGDMSLRTQPTPTPLSPTPPCAPSNPVPTRSGHVSSHHRWKTASATPLPTASRPSPSPKAGRSTPHSKPPARRTTSTEPPS